MSHCHTSHKRAFDWLLWGSLLLVGIGYALHLLAHETAQAIPYLGTYAHACFELMNKMWWGVALGIFFVGVLGKIPREFVISIIGRAGSKSGVVRATLAGLLLDLCSHGILLVGMKLYERGASLGQIMAFLIASPWNSLSLTLILIALIGGWWTLVFILASAVIAVLSGFIFDALVRKGTLPQNQNHTDLPKNFHFWPEARQRLKSTHFSPTLFIEMAKAGAMESRMILRWIFFGVVLASLMRTFLPPELFGSLFGPTLAGLGLTLIAATIIEVCSEGSTPIAADILTRAHAPGNAFAFLMAGVATDYTEVMAIKETTRSWKVALFLPLITLPQVIIISLIINLASGGQ